VSNMANGDSDELEALFDSIVRANAQAEAQAETQVERSGQPEEPPPSQGGITEPYYSQLGHLTRKLHETLKQLGYDKALEKAVDTMIPDARDRLAYIAALTQQAAERVLNATDVAKPIQEELETRSSALAARWDCLFRNELSVEEFKQLVHETRGFLEEVPRKTADTRAQLMEIMMAQDFQDLTGQVIKKVIDMAQEMESELLKVLVENTPVEKRAQLETGLLNGPVVNTAGRSDVVTSQAQVDELLESLGF
jgi:chemotaxis protein CheZ